MRKKSEKQSGDGPAGAPLSGDEEKMTESTMRDLLDADTVIPDEETLCGELLKADPSSHYQEHLYPLILRHAGQEMVVGGVVTALMMVFLSYRDHVGPMIFVTLRMRLVDQLIPRFLEILIPDPRLARAAKEYVKTLPGGSFI